jgi:hypothetical protein
VNVGASRPVVSSKHENFAWEGCDRPRWLDRGPPGGGLARSSAATAPNCFLGKASFLCRKTRNRPDPNSLLVCNFPDALACGACGSDCSDLGCVIGYTCGAPESRPFSLCPRQPGHHSLPDHRAFKLGKHAKHLKHCSAGRCGGVEPLLMQVEIDALGMEFLQTANRSVNDRPRRSTDHAATISISRRATACISLSSPGRLSRPLAPEMPWSL